MTLVLRILLIIASIITLLSMMRKIRKSKLQIEYAIFWVCFLSLVIIIAIFPEIVYFIARIIGIRSPVNIVFLIIIFVLILKVFNQTLEISQLEYKIQEIVQEMALKENENKTEKDNKEENKK